MNLVGPGKQNVGPGEQIGVAAECLDPGDSRRQNFEWRELHTTYQPDYNHVMGAACSAHVKDAKIPLPRHDCIGDTEIQFHSFVILALDGDEW